MNKRIKELFGQALDAAVPYTWHNLDHVEVEKVAKQFAELIVQECLAYGKLTQLQTVVNGSEEYNAGREMGIEVFMNQIKQHLGVTEHTGWMCSKCGVDRTREPCPLGHTAAITGDCPMTVSAQ